jgi:hypothetical protein
MNFSADAACRKWPIAAPGRGRAAMVTVAALLACLALGDPAFARRSHPPYLFGDLFSDRPMRLRGSVHSEAKAHSDAKVPLPKPRPDEAPAATPPPAASSKTVPAEPGKPAAPTATATPAPAPTPQPSACRLALTEEIAIAPSIPDIHGPGGCGGEDLVRLEAIVLPDKHRVSLKPAATLRCGMAAALADWVRSDVEPLAEGLGGRVSDLDNFDSYECRGRNRVAGALLSEHGRANALDVRGWKLANGQSIGLTDRNVPRGLRETVLHSACARFTTVLGPGSDGYHEDHIHLDLMERHNNYKICQWNVWDPMPQIAPLMPAVRPAEAPPREVAGRGDKEGDKDPDDDKGHAAKPGATGSDEPEATGDAGPDGARQTNSPSKSSQAGQPRSGKSKAAKSKADASKSDKSKSDKSKSDKSKSDETKKRRQDRRS